MNLRQLVLAAAVLPGDPLVPVAVVLYVLVSVLVAVPYTTWRRRGRAHAGKHSRNSSVRPFI